MRQGYAHTVNALINTSSSLYIHFELLKGIKWKWMNSLGNVMGMVYKINVCLCI